jgi:hypothetical protein
MMMPIEKYLLPVSLDPPIVDSLSSRAHSNCTGEGMFSTLVEEPSTTLIPTYEQF